MVVVECFTKFPRHEEESPWVFSRATARSPHVHGHSRAPTTFTVISRALQRALVCRCRPSAAFRMPEGLPPRRGLPPELTPKKQHVPVHLRSREANRTTCTSRYAHAAQTVPRAAAANCARTTASARHRLHGRHSPTRLRRGLHSRGVAIEDCGDHRRDEHRQPQSSAPPLGKCSNNVLSKGVKALA